MKHTPQNVNQLHEVELLTANFNKRVAVGMTKLFQSMWTFWVILAWILLWIFGNATIARFDPLPWPLLLCLASVPQLPLMIVIMVGQGLLGRKQELQADEQYSTTLKTFQDSEEIKTQLAKQQELLLQLLARRG